MRLLLLLASIVLAKGSKEEDITADNGILLVPMRQNTVDNLYVSAYVGSPVQQLKVSLDTGRDLTSLACGDVPGSFQTRSSSSFHEMTCTECESFPILSRCNKKLQQCRINYSDRQRNKTPFTASTVRDNFVVGGDDSHLGKHDEYSIPFNFGCQIDPSSLSPLSNGVLGLSNKSEASYVNQLYQAGKIPSNSYSMCFNNRVALAGQDVDTGYLALGGFDRRAHDDLMVYASSIEVNRKFKSYETHVMVRFMYFNTHVNGEKSKPLAFDKTDQVRVFSIDTTEAQLILPKSVERDFKRYWTRLSGGQRFKVGETLNMSKKDLRRLPSIILQLVAYESSDFTQDPNKVDLLAGEELSSKFPYDVILEIQPFHYIRYDPSSKAFYPNIDFGEKAVLGVDALRGYDVHFDHAGENKRIGFAKSACNYSTIIKMKSNESDLDVVDCVLSQPSFARSCEDTVPDFLNQCKGNPDLQISGYVDKVSVVENEGTDIGRTCVEVMNSMAAKGGKVQCGNGECLSRESCIIECSKYADGKIHEIEATDDQYDTDDGEYGNLCGDTLWSYCTHTCKQVRLTSRISREDGKCYELGQDERDCHIGACMRDDPCRILFKVHAVFGFYGGDSTIWSQVHNDIFSELLASLIDYVEPGDVTILMASPWTAEDDTDDSPAYNNGLKVVTEINIFDPNPLPSSSDGKCPRSRIQHFSSVAASIQRVLESGGLVPKLTNLMKNKSYAEKDPFMNVSADKAILIRSWTISPDLGASVYLPHLPGTGVSDMSIALIVIFLICALFACLGCLCGKSYQARIFARELQSKKGQLMDKISNKLNPSSSGKTKYQRVSAKSKKREDIPLSIDDDATGESDDTNFARPPTYSDILPDSDDIEVAEIGVDRYASAPSKRSANDNNNNNGSLW